MILAPPEGISEGDYEAIEAAVMETVRGRWFLAEFARRSRIDEMRQVLDAIGRLEQVVVDQRTLPPADPSVRLLVQRLKDVGKQLDALALDLRQQGHDEALCAKIETQARAVSGLLRFNPSPSPEPKAEIAASPDHLPPATPLVIPQNRETAERRLDALARLDALSPAEKLALFG